MNLGTVQGNRITLLASLTAFKRLGWGDKQGLAIFNLDYQAYKAGTGNNEWQLKFN